MPAWLQPGARLAVSSSRTEPSRAQWRMRVALIVLLALNAVAVFFLFRSPSGSAESRQRDLAALEAHHDVVQAQVQQLHQLRAKVLSATQAEQEFAQQNFLPRGSAFSQMIQNLSDLAAQNRLRPSDATYRLNEERNQLGWVYVEVSLVVEGQYPDLVRFVNQLEQSSLFWIIKGMGVSGQQQQQQQVQGTPGLRLNLMAATYLTPS